LYKYGHKNVSYIKNEKDIAKTLLKIIKPNDIIICLGAGSITKIANKLEENLNNELK
jgi:UDP-N-acetylmuramate--alanine ligase